MDNHYVYHVNVLDILNQLLMYTTAHKYGNTTYQLLNLCVFLENLQYNKGYFFNSFEAI